MADTFADDLLTIEEHSYEYDADAVLAAQEFADEHRVTMYVLHDGDEFAVSDRCDDPADLFATVRPR